MPVELIQIANYRAFGEKVKAWSKGEAEWPADLDAFKDQLAAADVGAEIPAAITKVRFVQEDEETLIVRLPCKTTLEAAEQDLAKPGAEYSLPAFYERTFAARPAPQDKLAFQAERIADYVISHCI